MNSPNSFESRELTITNLGKSEVPRLHSNGRGDTIIPFIQENNFEYQVMFEQTLLFH